MLVVGAIGYIVKSVFGYYNTRDKYQLNLTRSLYFQHLDSNGGVIHRIADESAEQEARECMLAYFVLWNEARPEGWTAAQLARRAQSLLLEGFELRFRFEAEDALRKLRSLDLLREQDGAHYAATAPAHAVDALRGARVFHHQPSLWGGAGCE
jgi:hypothetical protein